MPSELIKSVDVIVFLLPFIVIAVGFGTDPEFGRTACLELYPSGHEAAPQQTRSPYTLSVSRNSYNPGDMLTVTISSGEPAIPFRGFILQARSVTDPEIKVGNFIPTDVVKINCVVEGFGGKTVTHVNPSEKSSVQITWIAPAQSVGDIQFRATVVEKLDVYWVDITSDVISGTPSYKRQERRKTTTQRSYDVVTPVVSPSERYIQWPVEVDLHSCGMIKSCYRSPPECMDHCDYVVTWSVESPDVIQFELQASVTAGQGYVSMALSRDLLMGDDSVTECLYNSDTSSVIIQQSYNEHSDKDNAVLNNPRYGLVPNRMAGFYGNGSVTCLFARFVKPPPEDAEEKKVFNLNGDYHIFLAKGPLTNGMKGYHGDNKITSALKVNMASEELINIGGTSGYPLIKAHGILMILAWMVSASFAVLMPRYCKKAWPGKKCAGKDIWFQIHQAAMLFSLFLTAAGFVIIFIQAQGYAYYKTLPSKAHPVLGITTTLIIIINPIMAAFRPNPTSSKRPLFNLFHFVVGLAGQVLSVVTIYIGIYMPKAAMPVWSVKIMGAYVVWHVMIEIALTINKHCFTKSEEKSSSYAMKETGDKEQTPATPAPQRVSRVNTILPLLHLLGVVALSLALIIPLAMA